jgi:hypothetical protein
MVYVGCPSYGKTVESSATQCRHCNGAPTPRTVQPTSAAKVLTFVGVAFVVIFLAFIAVAIVVERLDTKQQQLDAPTSPQSSEPTLRPMTPDEVAQSRAEDLARQDNRKGLRESPSGSNQVDSAPLVILSKSGYKEYGFAKAEGQIENRSTESLEHVTALILAQGAASAAGRCS